MTSLKEEIKEIVDIVAGVPDPQKNLCFELLLKEALASRRGPPAAPVQPVAKATAPSPTPASVDGPDATDPTDPPADPPAGIQPKVNEGSDIALIDLHMKTRRFMEKGGVTIEHLNNVFYKQDGKFELLITDIGAKNMADGQTRVAMLQSLHRALTDGEFVTTVEAVREECRMRKCLDAKNFTKIFKNNADTFDFGEWSTDVTELRLSEDGKRALAEMMKKLS